MYCIAEMIGDTQQLISRQDMFIRNIVHRQYLHSNTATSDTAASLHINSGKSRETISVHTGRGSLKSYVRCSCIGMSALLHSESMNEV